MLEAFKLEFNWPALQAEVRQIDADDRRVADIGADQPLGFDDAF